MFDTAVDLVDLQPESQGAHAATGCGVVIAFIDREDVGRCNYTQVLAGDVCDTSLSLLATCTGLCGTHRLHCLLGLVL